MYIEHSGHSGHKVAIVYTRSSPLSPYVRLHKAYRPSMRCVMECSLYHGVMGSSLIKGISLSNPAAVSRSGSCLTCTLRVGSST